MKDRSLYFLGSILLFFIWNNSGFALTFEVKGVANKIVDTKSTVFNDFKVLKLKE